MLKSLFTSKPFIIAVCIFIFVCIACFMYYNAANFQSSKDASVHEAYFRSIPENTGDIDTSQRTGDVSGNEIVDDSSDIPSKQKETLHVSENGSDTAPSDKQSQSVIPEISEKEVRMSPFGLGPLPEIPEGWPGKDLFNNNQSLNHELIARVKVKLFSDEGIYASGGSLSHNTGLVYPITKDRIYVDWATTISPVGEPIRYISGLTAHPTIAKQIRSNARARYTEIPEDFRTRRRPQLTEDDIPSGIDVFTYSEGINPYEYLDLQNQ